MSFTIFQNEKTPFQAIKTTTSKSRKIDIFPKGVTHAFGPKVAIFGTFFKQYRAVKCILRYSRTKNTILGYKNKRFKSRKIDIGLTHGFGSKMGLFPIFSFLAIQHRKMSLTIFQNEKTPFQAMNTTTSKRRKIDIFPKGITH